MTGGRCCHRAIRAHSYSKHFIFEDYHLQYRRKAWYLYSGLFDSRAVVAVVTASLAMVNLSQGLCQSILQVMISFVFDHLVIPKTQYWVTENEVRGELFALVDWQIWVVGFAYVWDNLVQT